MENMMVPGGMFGDLRGPHCVSDNLEVVQAENGILRYSPLYSKPHHSCAGGKWQVRLKAW